MSILPERPEEFHPGLVILPTNKTFKMANRTFLPSAPNNILWIIALILGGLGILAHYADIEVIAAYQWELLMIGFLLLVLGTSFRKM